MDNIWYHLFIFHVIIFSNIVNFIFIVEPLFVFCLIMHYCTMNVGNHDQKMEHPSIESDILG